MAKQVMDIETHAIGILGDLKGLTLFYVPTCQQKGPCKNPLPAPAPSVPYLQKTLRKFQGYLETVMQKRVRDSISRQQRQGMASPDGVPSKKRKMDNRSKSGDANKDGPSSSGSGATKEEKPQSSTSSSSSSTSTPSPSPVVNEHSMLPDAETQKTFITQDLITILLATIDNLLRGLLSANQGMSMESEEEEEAGEDGDEWPIIDVGGAGTSAVENKGKEGESSSNNAPPEQKADDVSGQVKTETEVETENSTAKETANEKAPDQVTVDEMNVASSETENNDASKQNSDEKGKADENQDESGDMTSDSLKNGHTPAQ